MEHAPHAPLTSPASAVRNDHVHPDVR